MSTTARDTAEATTDLMRAVLALAADLDLTSLLERFVEASTELTGARYGAINILDEHGASRTFVQSGVDPMVMDRLGHAPHAVGVLGQIPDHGVLRLRDLTEHPAYQGLPAGHPPMGPFLGTAVRVVGETYGYLYLAEKDGGFSPDDEAVVGALGAAAAVAIQNAELYAVERRRENWLTAGQRITTMILEGADQEDVLTTIAATARRIDGADTAVLAFPGVDDRLVMEIVDGHAADELIGLVQVPGSRSVEVFASGEGDTVPSSVTAQHPLPPMRQFGPALYVPLRTEGQTVGVLILLRRKGAKPFTPSDLALSQTFAAQAALAVVLAEAREAQDAAALHGERARIARDLHDLAIQQLFAAGMQLESARQSSGAGVLPPAVTGMIDGALESVDSTVRQIRVIVRALDTDDATPPLVERLRREVDHAGVLFGFAPTLRVVLDGNQLAGAHHEHGDVDRIDQALGLARADHVVAVVREGLTNAARHARCEAACVRLDVRTGPDGYVTVEVEDDGVGLGEAGDRRSGTRNLASRAREAGGDFTMGTPPSGRGTLLCWTSPLG
ncbi:GAF domain-containing sensor histidine kinase [Cellulomonas bogoriensis]|uniref:Histidine kinase n=1 Tax=Cellulomonas bogoriensis 69B4 = DSM 16987 TaxID=1386082 RepID=A0A0A0C242_9CELL|nr:GAF domain-containing protein [Cellulomonas bogoriensis]KGM13474.1 histidine kinase [Cellulomonas bogoriensis 69B4 = DSM 16987]